MPEQEFGSDGQLHDVLAKTPQELQAEQEEADKAEAKVKRDREDAARKPLDPFRNSEAGAAVQREGIDPDTAAGRLRAFEDEHLGSDAPRFGNSVEKGHGSLFARLPPEKQKAHALIEKTADTETKLGKARSDLAIAENEHNTAVKQAEMAIDPSRLGSG